MEIKEEVLVKGVEKAAEANLNNIVFFMVRCFKYIRLLR